MPIGFQRRKHRWSEVVARFLECNSFDQIAQRRASSVDMSRNFGIRTVKECCRIFRVAAFDYLSFLGHDLRIESSLIGLQAAGYVYRGRAHLQDGKSGLLQSGHRAVNDFWFGKEIRYSAGVDLVLGLKHRDTAHRKRRGMPINNFRHLKFSGTFPASLCTALLGRFHLDSPVSPIYGLICRLMSAGNLAEYCLE